MDKYNPCPLGAYGLVGKQRYQSHNQRNEYITTNSSKFNEVKTHSNMNKYDKGSNLGGGDRKVVQKNKELALTA